MILLDTNVVSEVMRAAPSPTVLAWPSQQDAAALFFSTVTIAEIEYGLRVSPDGKRCSGLRDRFEQFLAPAFEGRVSDFDQPAARSYGEIMGGGRETGRPMSVPDGQIAAVARSCGLAVATRKVAGFESCEPTLINPFEGPVPRAGEQERAHQCREPPAPADVVVTASRNAPNQAELEESADAPTLNGGWARPTRKSTRTERELRSRGGGSPRCPGSLRAGRRRGLLAQPSSTRRRSSSSRHQRPMQRPAPRVARRCRARSRSGGASAASCTTTSIPSELPAARLRTVSRVRATPARPPRPAGDAP